LLLTAKGDKMLERIGGSRASIKTVVAWHPRFDVTRIVRLRRLPESTDAESEGSRQEPRMEVRPRG
jgi:hypothetical protein